MTAPLVIKLIALWLAFAAVLALVGTLPMWWGRY
jgi:hypothetical protein